MKVVELEKGMLLIPAADNQIFHVADWGTGFGWAASQREKYGANFISKYLTVRNKRKTSMDRGQRPNDTSSVAMYLGTKRDLTLHADWVDKFVLIDNQVVGVDPHAWKLMKPMVEKV